MNTTEAAIQLKREINRTFGLKRFRLETMGNKLIVTPLDEVDRQTLEAMVGKYVDPTAPYLVDGLPQLREVVITHTQDS